MTDNEARSVSFIAEILCLDVRRIQQLAKEQIIPKPLKGQYSLVGSVQGYVRYLQEKKRGGGNYNAEKTRHVKAQADLAELALEKARGEVVPLKDIEINVGNLFAEVRANIRNLPERIVSALVGMTDERKIKEIMLEEIDLILTTLADTAVVIEPTDTENTLTDFEEDE
jgi:phage terminase Nu1 subunit (DNA packaging protein)